MEAIPLQDLSSIERERVILGEGPPQFTLLSILHKGVIRSHHLRSGRPLFPRWTRLRYFRHKPLRDRCRFCRESVGNACEFHHWPSRCQPAPA